MAKPHRLPILTEANWKNAVQSAVADLPKDLRAAVSVDASGGAAKRRRSFGR